METVGCYSCSNGIIVHWTSPSTPGPYASTGVSYPHNSSLESSNMKLTSLVVDLKAYSDEIPYQVRAIILNSILTNKRAQSLETVEDMGRRAYLTSVSTDN